MIGKCSGAVGFEAVATGHRWVVHISGGSVGRGDLTPDREPVGHLGSPLGRAEQLPSRPKVCTDAAEGGQEPLRMPRRCAAFHRPFALSGALMRVLGAVVQIPRPPVLHRRHQVAVGDLGAAQLIGDQHARYRRPLSSLRKNRVAATAFRRDRTRTSSTLPRWSTARHRYRSLSLTRVTTWSRCHVSPGRGRRRRSWLA